MPIFSVSYSSMSAHYGPSYIEADSEYEARIKFRGTAFSQNEMGCIAARKVSSCEIARALQEKNNYNRED